MNINPITQLLAARMMQKEQVKINDSANQSVKSKEKTTEATRAVKEGYISIN